MSRLIKALQGSQRQSSASAQDQLSAESDLLSNEQDSLSLDNESSGFDSVDNGSFALDIDHDAFEEGEGDEHLDNEYGFHDTGLSSHESFPADIDKAEEDVLSEEVENLYLDIAAQEKGSLAESGSDMEGETSAGNVTEENAVDQNQVAEYIEDLLKDNSGENIQESPSDSSGENVQGDLAGATVDEHEGLHSEKFSDTSQSIAVMFAEHGGSEKNKNRWIYYSLAIIFTVSTFIVFTLDIGSLFSSQQAAVYSDQLFEEEDISATSGDVDESVQSIDPNEALIANALQNSPLVEQIKEEQIKKEQVGNLKTQENITKQKEVRSVSGIEFSRARKAPLEISAVIEAYQHYANGQLEQALSLYQQVLEDKPSSIDANLGLGTVLYELKDYGAALRYFERVLATDASHVFAMSKMVEIAQILSQESNSNALNENKLFNQQLPSSNEYVSDDAANYFYLGQVYAQRSRWSEAQQAFFQAHSMDKSNDLYTYNLAVALDQMQKSQLALPYYELVLQRKGVDELNYQQIQERVHSISKN